jgi:hypothetical protein
MYNQVDQFVIRALDIDTLWAACLLAPVGKGVGRGHHLEVAVNGVGALHGQKNPRKIVTVENGALA